MAERGLITQRYYTWRRIHAKTVIFEMDGILAVMLIFLFWVLRIELIFSELCNIGVFRSLGRIRCLIASDLREFEGCVADAGRRNTRRDRIDRAQDDTRKLHLKKEGASLRGDPSTPAASAQDDGLQRGPNKTWN